MTDGSFEKFKPRRTRTGFDNPSWTTWQGLPNLADSIKWYCTKKDRQSTNDDIAQNLPVIYPEFQASPSSGLIATWLGHATVLFQLDAINILSDPVLSLRCSPVSLFGPRRICAPPSTIDELPEIDVVIISHNHYDHLDSKAVQQLNARFGSRLKWFVPLGLKQWFLKSDCQNVTECDWWDEYVLDSKKDIKIVALPSQHWSYRNGFDKNMSLWCSWAVKGSKHSFYFAGDTGYCPAFKSIGHYYGPFTLAAIPIGCYEPRWFMKNQHINPEEAVQIHKDIKAETSIAIHWGTYNMGSTEDVLAPKAELKHQVATAGLPSDTFITLQHGQSWKSHEHCGDEASSRGTS